MNDDPAEVDVLYGKVRDLNENLVLQELADSIIKYFAKTGTMHILLLNKSLFKEKNLWLK